MSSRQEPWVQDLLSGLDPSLCALEPIHIPGRIQPHGALLAALADNGLVTHASANLGAILGRTAEEALGRSLEDVLGHAASEMLLCGSGLGDSTALGQPPLLRGPGGSELHIRAHRSGRHICVDIEPIRSGSDRRSALAMLQSVLATFKHASTRGGLCDLAVRGLKALTGYDRVMAYRFGEGGHGEVIAEAVGAQLEPYLGLRYPASDVPPPARRQYLLQRVGAIADSSYRPVPLLVYPPLDDGTPLDLTHSALRSVSPIHREYMRNMGTAASLTIGLAHGPQLWGMLVCHHTTPRIASPELREVADIVGEVVSLLLSSLTDAEVYAQRIERSTYLRALIDRLAAPVPLLDALAAGTADLLKLVDAAGAAVSLSGVLLCLGNTPPPSFAKRALAVLQAEAGGDALCLDNLGERHPELACCAGEGSGALLLPLAQGADDAILWFRPELAQTVTWGGNPAAHVSLDPATGRLSPRASFAAWKETVRGRSAPWAEADLVLARELRRAFAAEVAQRTKAELIRLLHYDPLTGLANRSLFQARLAEAGRETGATVSLLFLDLDRFKAVNDTMGHAAGDALLVEIARRLLATVGPENLAARLGGDEFVVLCRGVDRDALAALGERIRRAIEAPFEISGRLCRVSASIGTAVADNSGGLDLVRAADMAMYAAKQGGGNRKTMFEPSLYQRAALHFELEHDLRDALSGGNQLLLAYQPQFGIASGTTALVGFEALLRWRHPRHGSISPGLFIPLAEKAGLIVAVGNWVLARALREGRGLQIAHPDAQLRFSVNVSALELANPIFCSGLSEALNAERFSPAALCLEVTESSLSDVVAADVLKNVRALGVHVAIDDFGTGYSSLAALLHVPADVVKLDRSFFRAAEGAPSDATFIKGVIALVHATGMSVVLEGIETQAELEIASTAGADIVQGFLLARPVSAKAARKLVRASRLRA